MARRFVYLCFVLCLLATRSRADDFAVGDKVQSTRPSLTGEGVVEEVRSGSGSYRVRFTEGRMKGRSLPIPGKYLKLIEAATRPKPPMPEAEPENPFDPQPKRDAFREWADSTGKFKVEAKLVRFADGKVTLEKKDGRQVTVPASRLSEADQAFLRPQPAAPTDEPGSPSIARKKPGSGPPLAQANSAEWQVAPDPGAELGRFKGDLLIANEIFSPKILLPAAGPTIVAVGGQSSRSAWTVWDLRTGKQLGAFQLEAGWEPIVSPDASLFASVDRSGIGVYNVKSGKRLQLIPVGSHGTYHLDFCKPDVLVGVMRDKIAFWNAASGESLGEDAFSARGSAAHVYAISPGGNYFLAADGWAKKIVIVDTRNGNRAGTLHLTDDTRQSVVGVCFSQAGDEAAALLSSGSTVGAQMKVISWDLATGKVTAEIPIEELDKSLGRTYRYGGRPIEFLPDYGWLVMGRAVVKREDAKVVWIIPDESESRPRMRRVLNAQQFVSVDMSARGGDVSIEPIPWEKIDEGERLVTSGATVRDSGLPPLAKTDRSEMKEIAASQPSTAWRYEAADGIKPFTVQPMSLPVQGGSVRTVVFSDEQAFLSVVGVTGFRRGVNDATVLRYDLRTSKPSGKFSPKFPSELLDVSPNGQRMLFRVAENRDRLDVWTMDDGAHVAGLRPFQDSPLKEKSVRWACFVDDDHMLTQDVQGNLTLWKIPECSAVYKLTVSLVEVSRYPTPYLPGLNATVRSPSRQHVAMFANGKIYVVESATGRVVGNPELPTTQVAGILGLAFDPTETALASYLPTGLATWDLRSGKLQDQFPITFRGQGLWWAGDRQILVRGINWSKDRSKLNRLTLVDLDKDLIAWHYLLNAGVHAPLSPDGQAWYVTAEHAGSQGVLNAVKLPHAEASEAIGKVPRTPPVLGAGTKYKLDVTLRLIDKNSAKDEPEDLVRRAITKSLAAAGAEPGPTGTVELAVSVDELLAKQKVELLPFGFGRGKAVVDLTQFVCRMHLQRGESIVWEAKESFTTPTRLTGDIDADVGIAQQLKRAQWAKAIEWFGATRPELPLYSEDVFDGLGTSTLTSSGIRAATPAEKAPSSSGSRGPRTSGGRR